MKHLLFYPILTMTLMLPSLGSASGETQAKIQALKNPELSADDKWKLSRGIQKEGKKSIPDLIACLKDKTVIGTKPLTGGECINLPPHLEAPAHCKDPKENETLGERCQLLLYNIITPLYTSPYTTRISAKQMLPPPFVIPNWNTWWQKNKSKSLEQIHEEARKKIDDFWLGGPKDSVVWQ